MAKNSENKKILIIAPQFKAIPSNSGGVEGLITDLINENEKQKQCVFFVVSKHPDRTVEHNLEQTHLIYRTTQKEDKPNKGKYYFSWLIFRLIRKVIRNKITLKIFKKMQFSEFDDNYFGYYCSRIALKIKPHSIIIFGYDKIHHLWPLVMRVDNKAIFYHIHYCRSEDIRLRKLIPNTIATSKYVYSKWNKTHIQNEKSTVIYHGIDFQKFNYYFDLRTIRQKRRELNFSDSDFIVIFTGRLRPGKGILELLTAFDYISNDNIKLLMLGDFDRKTNNEEEYEAKVIEKVKGNQNIFWLGFVPNDCLSLYYACANVQVVPTVYEEAAGLVTIEGMLAGLPIIITKSGGMPEYVDDGCSFKLDIDNNLSKNIALSIMELYSKPELCKKMSEISKKCASRFTITNYYKNLLSFLFNQ